MKIEKLSLFLAGAILMRSAGCIVNDIVDKALSDVSSEDSEAIANIISSSGNDEIIEMVW